MFEQCTTLEKLNARRRELVQKGMSVATVNAAYNKARKELMDAKPEFRRVATYTAVPATPRGYVAHPIKEGVAKKNELIMGDGVIYI